MRILAVVLLSVLPALALAQTLNGVIIRCGASSGHAFFFKHDVFNPGGSEWQGDALSKGKIILVKLGEEWDIQFDDAIGSSGYRQDGASVVPLINKPGMLTVGALHSNYIDIYTFDFTEKKVAWSSNKLGPFAPKVAAYSATCE